MTDTAQDTAIRLDITVDVSRERAFTVFTEQFDHIKPHEQNLLEAEIEETVFERRVGGSVYDRGVDGSVCRWGEVLAFDPPRRLVIGWRINPQWQIETDPSRMSEVEVAFTEQGPDRTRVDLVHRHLERHGDDWESIRGAVGSEQGWPTYLRRYVELIAAR